MIAGSLLETSNFDQYGSAIFVRTIAELPKMQSVPLTNPIIEISDPSYADQSNHRRLRANHVVFLSNPRRKEGIGIDLEKSSS